MNYKFLGSFHDDVKRSCSAVSGNASLRNLICASPETSQDQLELHIEQREKIPANLMFMLHVLAPFTASLHRSGCQDVWFQAFEAGEDKRRREKSQRN